MCAKRRSVPLRAFANRQSPIAVRCRWRSEYTAQMQLLAENTWLLVLVGIGVGYVVWRFGFATLRMLSSVQSDEAPATEDVEVYDLRYECVVCGAQVRLTRVGATDDFDAPRHCHDDMTLVVGATAPH